MNTKTNLLKVLPHLGVLLFFFLIVLIYFYPIFEGKVLQQGDIAHINGVAQEILEYDKPSGWTGSIFAGMPTYHTTGYEPGINFIKSLYNFIYSDVIGPIFVLLITSYILFLILGAPWWLAAVGAIASAFSSYNIIILVAGHATKAWAIAFVPLVLSGMFLIFQKKYWLGTLLFTLALTLLIIANHLQITYYAALFCLILFIGFAVQCIRDKETKRLGKSMALLSIGIVFAVLSNLANLYTNFESGQESMRGKDELTPVELTLEQASDGLDKDYAFAWSYGKDETFSLLIPNSKGGASGGMLGKDSHLYRALKKQGAQVGKEIQSPTYWGEKPFTSGPVYFGAIICFLFLFACLIVPGKLKWTLLGATLFFFFLAWGKNFVWFNDFMFYHFPFYNKFRTVEMALVIPGFTFPILAVLAVKELLVHHIDSKKLKRSLFISFCITAGICFLFWIAPGLFFNFESGFDTQYGFPEWYYQALIEDRKELLQSDAMRSLIYIALATALLLLYIQSKNKKKVIPYLAAGLIIFVLVDLWSVDKRYLNTDHFVNKKAYNNHLFSQTTADKYILQDPDPSYRVLNLNNTFQDSRTSYYHKSIGGYHAAKLGRYQDLIDRRLTPEIASMIQAFNTAGSMEDLSTVFAKSPSLNMLNTRYIIYNPEQPPLTNPDAYGNAWFVQSYRFVSTPDDEMAALNTLDPKTEAVLDQQFEENLADLTLIPDTTASIEMTAYYPNKVEYHSSSSQKGLAVFSEIYYKNGWKAYIDGERVPISRADWILRALVIPEGEHQIEFVFDPDNIRLFGIITSIFSGLLLLLLIGSGIYYIVKKKKQ